MQDSVENTTEIFEPGLKKADFIIGVGASAGGLEALEQFVRPIPAKTGMAFVIIQHLSPDYKSMMVQLLSKHTQMEVIRAEDGMAVQPDCIYLIPPKHNLTIHNERLCLTEQKGGNHLNLPIDIFLRSLAMDCSERAIGVILSGTGTDGTLGIRSIKENNGMVIVQDPSTAKFDGMPKSAISTNLVDYILPCNEMAERLLLYIKHPMMRELSEKPDEEESSQQSTLLSIYNQLRDHISIDFSNYKQTTILRRLRRRVSILQLDSLEEYLEYITTKPAECNQLSRELLIGVTNFFRDPDAWEQMQDNIIPEIIKKNRGEIIRFWCVGCSTGEEAYSLAMLTHDLSEKLSIPIHLKIFATDTDQRAVEFAATGVYPESIAADLPSGYMQKYFVKKGQDLIISKRIRESVIFAQHNILQDPPFNRIHLISCRNLLIYIQPILQQKIFSFFRFALENEGTLFLGASESIGDHSEYFYILHKKWKIYKASGNTKPLISGTFDPPSATRIARQQSLSLSNDGLSINILNGTILNEYQPSCIIVDSSFDLINTLGDASRYFSLPKGQATLNVMKTVKEPLRLILTTALFRSRNEKARVHFKDIVRLDEENRAEITIIVDPILNRHKEPEKFIVIFEEQAGTPTPEATTESINARDHMGEHIQTLEQELQFTRENLQATIEELETSNEELQATNEELLAANEELQSTNEELQSVNEELYTVNAEYQNKIDELSELNSDMDNLLASTRIGTLFLDETLSIRKFTPAVTENFNIIEHDIGRPITHISREFNDKGFDEDLLTVLNEQKVLQREFYNLKGSCFLYKFLPYVTVDNNKKGVVLTMIDITDLKEALTEIKLLNLFIDNMPGMAMITDVNSKIQLVNRGYSEVCGYSNKELVGKPAEFLKSPDDNNFNISEYQRQLENNGEWQGRFVNRHKDGTDYLEEARIIAIKNTSGVVVNYVKFSKLVEE